MSCQLKKKFYCIGVMFILFGLQELNAQEEYQVRVAMMGNSITFGSTLPNPAQDNYASQLGRMLAEVYGDTVQIGNYGVSGRTMLRNSEKPLWNEIKFRNGLKFVPDICLILLGTNDSDPDLWSTAGQDFQKDYLAMIDTFQFRNPDTRFLVCYPPPAFVGNPFNKDSLIIADEILPVIDSVVAATGATLVDFFHPFEDSLHLFPDKLHPSIEGAKKMAEILFDKIQETDIIHQVEPGLAFVSTFEQVISPVAQGSTVKVIWETIFADSVFLDGELVGPAGNFDVVADETTVYTLVAKGPRNTSEFPMRLNTYVPQPNGLKIATSSNEYRDGKPVVLLATYTDQLGRDMIQTPDSLSWTIVQGEGLLTGQTDSSIVFTPTTEGTIVVEVRRGELTKERTLIVNQVTTSTSGILGKELAISVFPNPVSGKLNFDFGDLTTEKNRIKVFDISGKLRLEQDFPKPNQRSFKFQLDVSNLQDGAYLYHILTGDKTIVGRFVKKL